MQQEQPYKQQQQQQQQPPQQQPQPHRQLPTQPTATHRYHIPKSVSDLYGTGGDEIDFLLDEIKDLEPACCQLEDLQVPEIRASAGPRESSPISADHFLVVVPSQQKKRPPKVRSFLSRLFAKKRAQIVDNDDHHVQVQFHRDRQVDTARLQAIKRHKQNKSVQLVGVDEAKQATGKQKLQRQPQEPPIADDEDIVPISIGENDDVVVSGGEEEEEDKNKTDFDIAGSRAGELSLSLESPLGTVTSWDSHAFYRQRIGLSQMTWGVQLHCDSAHLKTSTGIVRILLVISSAICLACECSAGTVQVGLFLLPLIGRLRLMVFCALFSLLVTCLMLFLDVSHIALMFPFNWSKVNAWMYLCIGLLFIIGSSLLVHMVWFAEAFAWVPRHTKDTLFVSAIFGYVCAIEALFLSVLALCKSAKYLQVPEDQSELFDRELSPMSSGTANHKASRRSRNAAKRQRDNNSLANNHLDERRLEEGPENEHEGHREDEEDDEEDEEEDTDENQGMLDGQVPNHCGRTSQSSYNQKPYIPAKRPDQVHNKPATLGHGNVKTSNRYRQGYHYQPVASTSQQQSPTFVLDDDAAVPGSSKA